ncbi:MAG: hypothetical protein A2Z14_19630 [Chloroflexi bacterium RBG_16_48_8]|nr:MAG: hypothetical protein A2Z14_19630 [Chloroflexi bacterium RBG_16_48_8]
MGCPLVTHHSQNFVFFTIVNEMEDAILKGMPIEEDLLNPHIHSGRVVNPDVVQGISPVIVDFKT